MFLVNKTDSFAKLREAYKYVHLNHPNEFDWILKTNIIAFVVLENLRHFLYQYDSDWPLIAGQRTLDGVKKNIFQRKKSKVIFLYFKDYMLGVFALSKRAFTRLLEDAFTNTDICALTGHEDREVMKCLEHVNVIKIDGIDRQGKGMIFKHGPEPLLLPEQVEDPNKNYVHKFKQGFENCCSDRLIATQSVWATELYYMEYFIYKVHAFGVCQKSESLPEKFTLDEVLLSHL